MAADDAVGKLPDDLVAQPLVQPRGVDLDVAHEGNEVELWSGSIASLRVGAVLSGMSQVEASHSRRTRLAASSLAAAVGFRSTPIFRNRLRARRYRSEIT